MALNELLTIGGISDWKDRCFHVASISDTHDLACRFGASLDGGERIGLIGDLGSGKTEFMKHLALFFGVKELVSSPTYVLQHIYKTSHERIYDISHWDLYRLTSQFLYEELEDELFTAVSKRKIVAIEWIDRIASWQKCVDIAIFFSVDPSHASGRIIRFAST